MSDSSIMQSSGSTAFKQTSPPERTIFLTTADEEFHASPRLRPSISRSSQNTESTRVDPVHTTASGSSTTAEEEAQPCLDATSNLLKISQEKEPSQPKLARNIVDNLGSSSLALATGLLPIYFLLFATLAFYNNNAVLEPGSQAEWLLVAAKYGPSVFPIMFAAIMGQFMTVIAAWKLERSINIGLLEYLLASRSLGSAFLSLMKLRIFNTWVPLVLSVWCLSPLGGQASLRSVFPEVFSAELAMDLHYLDNNNTTPINIYATFDAVYGPAIDSVFVAALASPNTSKYGPQDMYGNLHLPMLESMTFEPDADGWYDLKNQDVPSHPALLGIPFIGVPKDANSTFAIATSYVFCSCTVAVGPYQSSGIAESMWNISTEEGAFTSSKPDLSTATYGRVNSSGTRLRDVNAAHRWNETYPRMFGLQSRDYRSSPALETKAWCNMSTTYIDLHVGCTGGPQNCNATSVRQTPNQPWPAHATTLDCIWSPGGLQSCMPTLLAASFFSQFINAVPDRGTTDYTAFDQFFLTPAVPFLHSSTPGPIGNIGNQVFSQRLTQLVNTYLLASSAPYAISGNFSKPNPDEYYAAGRSIAGNPLTTSPFPSYGIQSTQGRVQRSQIIIRCHVLWTIVLIAISSLLIATGLSTAILDSRRKGPQVLDDFTSSLRYNPYASIEQKNSIEDGIDIARRSRHVRVQLGDVRPHDGVGLVAVATTGDDEGQTVERLRRRRLYA